MASYKLFPAAEADLENIWCFLTKAPLVCRERFKITPPVRIFHHDKHLIVYLVQHSEVLVVSVLHEGIDIGEQLAEE